MEIAPLLNVDSLLPLHLSRRPLMSGRIDRSVPAYSLLATFCRAAESPQSPAGGRGSRSRHSFCQFSRVLKSNRKYGPLWLVLWYFPGRRVVEMEISRELTPSLLTFLVLQLPQ